MGIFSDVLENILKAIGKSVTIGFQFIFISIVLGFHAGVMFAGISGNETLLTYLQIGSVAMIVLPTLVKKLVDDAGGHEEAMFFSVLAVGAYYDGIVGKFVFILKYGLVVTNVVGIWLIS